MRTISKSGRLAASLACMVWIIPVHQLQAENGKPFSEELKPFLNQLKVARDVELGEDGRLTGQVMNETGKPLAGQPVYILQPGQKPKQTVSDDQGRFTLAGLKPGVHYVVAGNALSNCRFWSKSTAPPKAEPELLMVSDSTIVRGQRPIGEILSGPVLIGLIIASAVAIPIAIHNSRDSAS